MKIYLQAEKILVANKAIDFRKSLDGLCALITEEFGSEPMEGLYIFYNKDRNKIKILGHHVNGFIMIYKRLESGKFFVELSENKVRINRQQLEWLMLGVDYKLLAKNKEKYLQYS
jgi:transposase